MWRERVQIVPISNAGTTNIELAMTEAGRLEVEASDTDGLTLAFIDCQGKAKSNWELNPLEFERSIRGGHGNSGNQHNFTFSLARNDGGFQDSRHHLSDD